MYVRIMADTVSATRVIAASDREVWDLVSDLPRMGEWSNENVGGRWLGVPAGPIPGAVFRGSNRNGIHRWSTKVTVVDAAPGEVFRFRVDFLRIPISEWVYEFQATSDGCRVTESWTDRRPGWFKPVARLATGVGDRAEHTRDGIALTLERLSAAAESPAA